MFANRKIFPHRKIHNYTWISPDGKTHSRIYHILVDRRQHSCVLDVDLSDELTVILITIWWLHKLRKDWSQINKQHKRLMWKDLI